MKHMHFWMKQVDTAFTLRVVASNSANGPFEGIGTDVVVASVSSSPTPPKTVRVVRKTSNSLSVSWVRSAANGAVPEAQFFVVKLCNSTVCGLFPNVSVADAASAQRFYGTEATVGLLYGMPLSSADQYSVTVYACGYYDADNSGVWS
jgi:hypothetical protein